MSIKRNIATAQDWIEHDESNYVELNVPAITAVTPSGPLGDTITIDVIPGNTGADAPLRVILERSIDGASFEQIDFSDSGTSPTVQFLDVFTPDPPGILRGHQYDYRVRVFNRFEGTVFSPTFGIFHDSAFLALTLNSASRVDNVITLAWTDPNSYGAADVVEIQKDIDGSGFLTLAIIEDPALVTSFDDAFDFLTMVPATYTYRLRARSGPLGAPPVQEPDDGPFSNTQANVVSFILSQITALSAVPSGGDTQIDLTWTDPNPTPNEAGIRVQRKIGINGVFETIADLAPGTTAFSDIFTTSPGQTYIYRVAAFNSFQIAQFSTEASATTSLLVTQIVAIQQLADVGARVIWTDPNLHEDNYFLERRINGGPFSNIAVLGPNTVTFDDEFSQSIGDLIEYRVHPENAGNVGGLSAITSFKLTNTLFAPTNVIPVFEDDNLVRITWRIASTGERAIRVSRSTGGLAFALIDTLGPGVETFDDAFPVIPGETYCYKIQAINNQEAGPDSDPGCLITPFEAPTSLRITATTATEVTLEWDTVNVLHDIVEIEKAFGDGPFVFDGTVQKGTTTSIHTITGGTPGAVVKFRVREVKDASLLFGVLQVARVLGRFSEIVSTASPLIAPTGVAVTRPTENANLITWADTNTEHDGFRIFRRLTIGGSPGTLTLIRIVNDAAAISVSDFVPAGIGILYEYQVVAFSSLTTSPLSVIGAIILRIGRPIMSTVQTDREEITLTITPPDGYVFAGGDQALITRGKEGGKLTTLVSQVAQDVPFNIVDTDVSVGEKVSYAVQFFSALESGGTSLVDIQEVFDIVPMPIGTVRQIRIHGSRFEFIQRGIFAACDGGVAKITEAVGGDPLVTTQTGLSAADARSVVSGNENRIAVFTGASPGIGNALLLDANNLNIIDSEPMTFEIVTGLFSWQIEQHRLYADLAGATYNNEPADIYSGWIQDEERTVSGIIPPGDWNTIIPNPDFNNGWDANSTNMILAKLNAGQEVVPNPRRFEGITDDVLFITQNAGTSTMFRAVRKTMTRRELHVFKDQEVMDFVTDGLTRAYVVTRRGEIILIDMSISSFIPGIGVIGNIVSADLIDAVNPRSTLSSLINPATGFITIELAAASKLIVGVTHVTRQAPNTTSTTMFIFDIPNPVSATTPLVLASKKLIDEKVNGIAFDGGKFLYANSADTDKLYRINAGF